MEPQDHRGEREVSHKHYIRPLYMIMFMAGLWLITCVTAIIVIVATGRP